MYRDDVCAVCGESLPPDHLYCREHAAEVDDRLHELGALLPRLDADLRRAAELVGSIHPDTWDYLVETAADDADARTIDELIWPPHPTMVTTTDGEDVDVDVDSEPGQVTVRVRVELARLLADVADAVQRAGVDPMAAAARTAEGLGATH